MKNIQEFKTKQLANLERSRQELIFEKKKLAHQHAIQIQALENKLLGFQTNFAHMQKENNELTTRLDEVFKKLALISKERTADSIDEIDNMHRDLE